MFRNLKLAKHIRRCYGEGAKGYSNYFGEPKLKTITIHNFIKSLGSFLFQNANEISVASKILIKSVSKTLNKHVGKELINQRTQSMGPNVSVFYKQEGGLVITKGEGVYMIDIDNNKYLDCCNNVAAVGHSHPTVVKAGQKALGEIQTNGRFLHPTQQRYVAKLLATFPPELNTVYLVNSGVYESPSPSFHPNKLSLSLSRAIIYTHMPFMHIFVFQTTFF